MALNSSMKNPLVSIIIPFKNREKLLLETLESVKGQTYKKLEIILIDDGSEKPFESLIAEKLDGFSYKYFKNTESKGPGYSRQKGVEQSLGEYVVYLDSDDLLHPLMLQKCGAVMTEKTEYGMCYAASAEFNKTEELQSPEQLKIRKRSNVLIFENLIIEMLTKRRVWDTSACFWRKSAIQSFEPWINNFQMEDYAYDMQIQAKGIKVINIPEVLCYYRRHPDSLARSQKLDLSFQRLNMLIYTSNYVERSSSIPLLEKRKIQKLIARNIVRKYRDGIFGKEHSCPEPLSPGIRLITNCGIFHSVFIAKAMLRLPVYEVFFNE